MRMDMRYIAKQSIWFDIKLILKTIKVVVKGDGY
jgi:lipopolysaccharide/colanic/teichoic acid biosynthesis glycosyltransferase